MTPDPQNGAVGLLNRAIDYLQAKLPVNRVVVLLTPLVFVPAAAYVAALVAKYLPGVQLSEGAVVAAFVGGGLSAVTLAYKWVDGWQKSEARKAQHRPQVDL